MKRMLIALLALTMCLSGCGINNINDTSSSKGAVADDQSESAVEQKPPYTQEQVNELVFAGLSSGKKEIKFDRVVSNEMVQQAVYDARYECPDVFWTTQFVASTDQLTTTLICDSIHDLDESQLATMYVELNKSVEEIIAEIDSELSDYDKLLALHDKLIELCDYDYESFGISDPEIIGFAGSSYGCLVEHKAFCEGYAQAFSLVARRLGFECGMVCGTAQEERHAWNYVKADGEYYWLDVTWDENTTESDTSFPPMHKYFLLNDELFMGNRTVDDDVPFYPECTAWENNYYVHNGLYLKSYDFEEINRLMDDHADIGGLDVMFANDESYEAAISGLMEQGEIWSTHMMLNGLAPNPYYADPELRTLTFDWQ